MKKLFSFILALTLLPQIAFGFSLPQGSVILTSPEQISHFDIQGQVGKTGESGSYLYGTPKLGGFSNPTQTGGGTPGGADTQIQYNNNGAFGGSSNLTWNGTQLDVKSSLYSYTMTPAPLVNAGSDYNFGGGMDAGSLYLASTTFIGQNPNVYSVTSTTLPTPIAVITGTEDIGVAMTVLNLGMDGIVSTTMYFNNSAFANLAAVDAYWQTLTGPGLATTTYFKKSIFTANGVGNNYTWANPDSKVLVTGFTTPPQVHYALTATPSVTMTGGNFTADGDIVAKGRLSAGLFQYGGSAIQSIIGGTGVLGFQSSGTVPSSDSSFGQMYVKGDGLLYYLSTNNVEHLLTTTGTYSHASCWLTTSSFGYCTSIVGASGTCTCIGN